MTRKEGRRDGDEEEGERDQLAGTDRADGSSNGPIGPSDTTVARY